MFEDSATSLLRLAFVSAEILQHVSSNIDTYEVSFCAYQMIKQIDEMAASNFDDKKSKRLLN
jgi:hypothetical protein